MWCQELQQTILTLPLDTFYVPTETPFVDVHWFCASLL